MGEVVEDGVALPLLFGEEPGVGVSLGLGRGGDALTPVPGVVLEEKRAPATVLAGLSVDGEVLEGAETLVIGPGSRSGGLVLIVSGVVLKNPDSLEHIAA